MDAKSHYLVGLSLWAFHTHIYNQYSKSPRLSILNPVPNCGKTTVLDILNAMVWNPRRMIDPTVASTFRLANSHTLLIDEVDNMSVVKNMRAILNAGHGVGGSVDRTNSEGNVISYNVYGPVVMAGIGKLPASLISRSLVIQLRRSNKQMQPFKPSDQYYAPQFYSWGAQAALNPNPQMPIQLIGREADKWRPLIAIADYFDQGDIGRAVALEFLNESNTPDIEESILVTPRECSTGSMLT